MSTDRRINTGTVARLTAVFTAMRDKHIARCAAVSQNLRKAVLGKSLSQSCFIVRYLFFQRSFSWNLKNVFAQYKFSFVSKYGKSLGKY